MPVLISSKRRKRDSSYKNNLNSYLITKREVEEKKISKKTNEKYK